MPGKSAIQAKYERQQAGEHDRPSRRFRFSYGPHPDFEVWFARVDTEPKRQVRMYFPAFRLYEDGTKEKVPWTEQKLIDAMQTTMRIFRHSFGGRWIVEVRKPDAVPEIYEPGPTAAERVRQALRETFETPPVAPVDDYAEPRPFDAEHDPELWETPQPPISYEPGEKG